MFSNYSLTESIEKSMADMKLSIIIVNYNHPFLIGKCIRSIARSNILFPYEIVIVDNASHYDVLDQVARIKEKYPELEVQIIKNKENIGFGKANNQGVEKARGEFILLLNTDIQVLDNAIEKLVSVGEQHADSIVGGKLLNHDKTEQPSAGPFYSLPVTFGMLFLKGDTIGLTRYSPSVTKKVDWVSGACMLMKRKTFTGLKGFDESIFMYMEEVDLCYRAKQVGLTVLFYPGSQFIHYGAATAQSRTGPILNIYHGLLYFYKKHGNYVQYKVLTALLASKAIIGIMVGVVFHNTYLTTTYKKALSLL